MEKFTPEIKDYLVDEINRMKRMLDKIAEQLKDLPENAEGMEFAPIVIDANRVLSEMEALKRSLKEWEDINFVEHNVFGE